MKRDSIADDFADPTKFVQFIDVRCPGSDEPMKPILIRQPHYNYDPPGVVACVVCRKGWDVKCLSPRDAAKYENGIAPEHTRKIVDPAKHPRKAKT